MPNKKTATTEGTIMFVDALAVTLMKQAVHLRESQRWYDCITKAEFVLIAMENCRGFEIVVDALVMTPMKRAMKGSCKAEHAQSMILVNMF
jgi:hypothetical protein